MDIIDRILQLLEQRNITANRLAVECKLNSSAMTDWKKGKSKPSTDALAKIADYFNVSVDYLIGREKPPPRIPPHIAEKWNALGEEEKKLVERNIDRTLELQRQSEQALLNRQKKLS